MLLFKVYNTLSKVSSCFFAKTNEDACNKASYTWGIPSRFLVVTRVL